MLKDIIAANGLTGTAAEILAKLTVSDIQVDVDTLRTGRETLIALQAAGIDPEIVVPAVKSTHVGQMLLNQLSAEGVNWRDPVTKSLLSSLVASHPDFTQQMADVLVGMNEYTINLCEKYGIDTPTEAEVQVAIDSLDIEQAWVDAQNTHINAAVASGDRVALAAALRAAATDLEA